MAKNNEYEYLSKQRIQLIIDLDNAQKKLNESIEEGTASAEELSKAYASVGSVKKELKKVVTSIKEITTETSGLAGEFGALGTSINSLTDLQSDFKKEITKTTLKGLELSQSIGDMNGQTKDSYKQALENGAAALEVVASLAGLNKEDTIEIAQKQIEYDKYYEGLLGQYSILEKSTDLTQEQKDAIKELSKEIQSSFNNSKNFYNIDKEHEELLTELNEDYKTISKTLKKVTTTAEIFFSSGKNAVGIMLIGASKLANKFSELGRNLGFTLTQMVGLKSEMLLMNEILGEASSESVQELGKQLGGIGNVTSGMALDAGIMAYNFGLGGDEAGYLSVAFGKLQGQSYETGKNTIEFVRQLSLANGVAPSQVMKDIAHNTEAMALFSKDGGKNIATAALQAAKLGVNLSTTAKLAEHLLDYQSSVDDEMEASVLLGRQLNLGKARELAYNNDIAGATNEALKAVGGIGEWEKMSYYQRQATAKALGISAEEMQQMVSHQKDLNGMNGVGNVLYSRTADTLSAIANTTLGKITGGLGGMLMTLGNVNFGFQAFGYNMFGKGGAISALLRWLGLMKSVPIVAAEADAGNAAVGAFTGVASRNATTKSARAFKTQQPIQPQTGATPKSFLDKVGSPTQMYAVAAALLAFGAAIWMISKAFQNFGEVTDGAKTLGLFAAAIVGMGFAIIGISWALTALSATGALEVAAIGMLAFGAAILMIGGGIKLMGDGFTTMTTSLNPLIALIPQLFLLALAFSAVAASMALLGTASIVALPALAVLGFAAGAGSAMLSGGKGDTSQQLLDQIVGLREDLNKGKVAVFLDGIKVNKELAVVKAQNKLAGT